MEELRIVPAGDRAVAVEFENKIDPVINDRVHALAARITEAQIPGVTELNPAFCSLLVFYEPSVIRYAPLCERLQALSRGLLAVSSGKKRILKIPCCYGVHFGPDLKDLERHSGLTRDEIIALHSQMDYKVYMLGFLPGFVYLGGLDARIAMPRLATPRVRIPKGAVGIGGNQTGVYPVDSPGGWRLIGSTPLDFYDPDREKPVLCEAGDYIRFVPVSSCDYYDIRQMLLRGTYQLEVKEV